MLAHLSLFSGIGGLDLAAEAAGFPTVAFCERDTFCRRVLAHHWPGVPCYDDIHAITADRLRADGIGPVGIVSGGPPCQPASVAGRRGGVDDARWLWPEYLRVVAEVRPRWTVAENPTGIFSLDAGRPFGAILAALDALGYVGWWGVWGAGDVGAPHRRERVFVVGRLADAVGDESQRDGIAGNLAGAAGRVPGATWEQRIRGTAGHSGTAVADAEGTRPSQRVGRGTAARPGPECCGEGVADATSQFLNRAERTRRGRAGLADAGSGTAQPGLGGEFDGFSSGLDGYTARDQEGKAIDADAEESRPREALRRVREATGPQTVQGDAGEYEFVPSAEVLRSGVFGDGASTPRAETSRAEETGGSISAEELPQLRIAGASPRPPYRPRSVEQRPVQPDDLVRILSREMALGAWEEVVAQSCTLHNLRFAFQRAGILPETLSALQEAWRSLPRENQHWIAAVALGLPTWPARPGEAQHGWEPPRTVAGRVPDRVARLRALGNAVVPQQAAPIFAAIAAYERTQGGDRMKGGTE